MRKIKETEYMYASARLRMLENRMVGRERVEALCDARTGAEVRARLAEYGIAVGGEPGAGEEAVLPGILRDAYDEVASCVPDAAVFDWMRFPYDCNNLKMALKCHIRQLSVEETAGLLFDFGTVPAADVLTLIGSETPAPEFAGRVPPELLEALSDAREAFAKSGDPRQIDLRLDRACYRAMLAAATATGEPMLAGWVRAKIDLVNVMITLRILRLSLGASAGQFLEEALLSGGSLDPDFFRAALGETGGEDNLLWRLRTTRQPLLEGLVRRMEKTDKSLSALEKCCDDTHMELVRHDARVPFGVGVPGGYLYGWETAVRNIRIILAAREAGLTPAQTRERVRESYV